MQTPSSILEELELFLPTSPLPPFDPQQIVTVQIEKEGGEKDKRRRKLVACESCRKRKQRCCGVAPCAPCVTRNIQCVFTAPTKKRGFPPGHLQKRYVVWLMPFLLTIQKRTKQNPPSPDTNAYNALSPSSNSDSSNPPSPPNPLQVLSVRHFNQV